MYSQLKSSIARLILSHNPFFLSAAVAVDPSQFKSALRYEFVNALCNHLGERIQVTTEC